MRETRTYGSARGAAGNSRSYRKPESVGDATACPRWRQLSPKAAWRLAGPPITLGDMCANGVRSLDVSCRQCHHRTILSADPWPDHVSVPSFGPRMVCIVGADARPNWQEQTQRESLTRVAMAVSGEQHRALIAERGYQHHRKDGTGASSANNPK
jgi:hypothetical protein